MQHIVFVSGAVSLFGSRQIFPMPRRRNPDRDRVDVEEYFGRRPDVVPIAIPSRGREVQLCAQTLDMLKRYGYPMTKVHVFVDAASVRDDGSLEFDNYTVYLRNHGYANVQVHPEALIFVPNTSGSSPISTSNKQKRLS